MTSENSHQPQLSNGTAPSVDPAPDADRPLVPRVLRLFQPYKFQVTLVVLLVVATAGFGVINPVLVKFVFDNGLFPEGGPNMQVLWMLAGAMAVIAAASGALSVAQTFMTNKVGQYVMRDLRDDVYAHLQGMPLRFFTGTRTGEIQSRVTNDVSGVQQVVTATASDTLFNVVSITSSVIAMLILSWQLTLVALVTVPFYFILAQWVGRKRRAVTSLTSRSTAEMTAITQETLSVSGIMLAKLFGRQNEEMENFRRHNQELSDLTVRQQMIGHAFFSLVMAFLSFSPAAIYPAGRVPAFGQRGHVGDRRNGHRLHHPAEPHVFPRGPAAAGVRGASVVAGPVRAHILLPRPQAGDHRLSGRQASAEGRRRRRDRIRLGARQLPAGSRRPR